MVIVPSTTQLPGVLGREISTEMAVNVFGLGAGVFGGLAGIIAGQRLGQVSSSDIPLGVVLPGLAIAGISTVVGAYLLPTEL